jgi:hypothetical protein
MIPKGQELKEMRMLPIDNFNTALSAVLGFKDKKYCVMLTSRAPLPSPQRPASCHKDQLLWDSKHGMWRA